MRNRRKSFSSFSFSLLFLSLFFLSSSFSLLFSPPWLTCVINSSWKWKIYSLKKFFKKERERKQKKEREDASYILLRQQKGCGKKFFHSTFSSSSFLILWEKERKRVSEWERKWEKKKEKVLMMKSRSSSFLLLVFRFSMIGVSSRTCSKEMRTQVLELVPNEVVVVSDRIPLQVIHISFLFMINTLLVSFFRSSVLE